MKSSFFGDGREARGVNFYRKLLDAGVAVFSDVVLALRAGHAPPSQHGVQGAWTAALAAGLWWPVAGIDQKVQIITHLSRK